MSSCMTNLSVLFLAAVLAAGSGLASGKDCNGVSFPDQVQTDAGTLALNGLGLRQATAFKVNVYVGALYVPKASADAAAILGTNAPYELRLQFVRKVGADDLGKGWTEGFEKNSATLLPTLKERIAALNEYMGDAKAGEKMTFVFRPGVGVQVRIDGTAKGTIKGDDFGKAFLAIWLGAQPPNPEIKTGLLGGSCG